MIQITRFDKRWTDIESKLGKSVEERVLANDIKAARLVGSLTLVVSAPDANRIVRAEAELAQLAQLAQADIDPHRSDADEPIRIQMLGDDVAVARRAPGAIRTEIELTDVDWFFVANAVRDAALTYDGAQVRERCQALSKQIRTLVER